jgi:hypothetical protein
MGNLGALTALSALASLAALGALRAFAGRVGLAGAGRAPILAWASCGSAPEASIARCHVSDCRTSLFTVCVDYVRNTK